MPQRTSPRLVGVAAAVSLVIVLTAAATPALRPPLHSQRAGLLRTVTLSKQQVPVLRNGRAIAHKTAYFGTVFVGLPNPQPFTVLFDTGSGHVVLPSETCESVACKQHRRYFRGLSSSAKTTEGRSDDIAANGSRPDRVDLEYGTGKVSGEFLDEVVCFDSEPRAEESRNGCTRLTVVLASSLSTDPFEHFSFDGVIGLGLESLSLHKDFSFVGRLEKDGDLPEPCFSVFLSKSDDQDRSEISFGGHKEEHSASDFNWSPVVMPEQGFWQVALKGVRVGDEPLSLCADGGCRAMLDTGTSMLGVPEKALSHLHRTLARLAEPTDDCRYLPGLPIIFDFGGFELRLDAQDYSRPTPMRVKGKVADTFYSVCRSSLLPVPAHVGNAEGGDKAELFVFGEPFLQKYLTKYDWRQRRVGFALARQQADAQRLQVV